VKPKPSVVAEQFRRFQIKQIVANFIRDRNGNITLWQTPNIPIIGWFVCLVSSHFIPAGVMKAGFASLSTAFLFTWAYLEITGGASYFRRVLGAVVLASVLMSFLR
jgi:hypothetical protein